MDTLRPCLIGILAAFCVASANVAAAVPENNPVLTHPAAETQPMIHRVLVKLRSSNSAASAPSRSRAKIAVSDAAAAATAQAAINVVGVRTNLAVKQTREIIAGLHAVQIEATGGDSLAATLARLKADPDVEFAVPDQRRYPHAVPNDPLYTGQWYLQNQQPAAIDAMTAWDTTTGRSDIVIAEIDTGIRYDHPDLRSSTVDRLLPGYDFISDPTIANDGDGRDADASDPGDWVTTQDTQTTRFSGCTVEDSSWHGTRVAGILGAIANNAVGVTGITWKGMVLPVRALGKCGGLDSDILDAMRWAAGLHVTGVPDNTHPAHVINMSLGGTGACTTAQQMVVNEIVAKGVVIVVSAGNEGGPVDSPANCVGVASVAGLRNIGTKVGFSSLGPEVAVSAPGGNCVNTGAGQPCLFTINTTINSGTTTPAGNTYTDQTVPNLGTSFSAPIVSGIAALMTGVNGNLNAAQIISRIREGAKTFPVSSDNTVPSCHVPANSSDIQGAECNCNTSTCGAGMANAPGAVNAALRPVAAVTLPTTVSPGQNVVLKGMGSAAACGHTVSTYAWSSVTSGSNAIQGANTSTATVVAPASGSFTVRLTVMDEAGKQDTADVVVSATAATSVAPATATGLAGCPAPPVAITVTPTTASVEAMGGSATFAATVTNTTNTNVTWQVNGAAGGNSTVGTISTLGVYMAPGAVPSPATVSITAVSGADSTKMASASVTVVAPIGVSVTPGTAAVTAGTGTQTFTASVTNSTNMAVTWQVNGVTGGNSTVGTISTGGLFTAPALVPNPATVSVTAISVANNSRSGTAMVTISPQSNAATSGSSSSSDGGSGGSSGGGGGAMDWLTLGFAAILSLSALLRRQRSLIQETVSDLS